VGVELRRWEHWAEEIPNATLREQALSTLREETLNPEGVAVFATLAPRTHRKRVTRLLAGLQAICDYLDTLSEQPAPDPLRNGLQLHRALTSALQPGEPGIDYYRYHPHRDDGGYLQRLIDVCRECLETLPSTAAILPTALRAAKRCGEGQSHTHAAIYEGTDDLAAWALRQSRTDGYSWWELAAGGISSISLCALLAAAADPDTTPSDAERIEASYFPSFCAFSALLDSLVDYERDARVASHSSIGHYPTNLEAASRLAHIAGEAEGKARQLKRGRRNAAILAGIAGFYLSAAEAETPFAQPIKARIIESLGPTVPPIVIAMRLRRRLGRARGAAEDYGSAI
jgi:tetraprenyl-beta-curcumene synthase